MNKTQEIENAIIITEEFYHACQKEAHELIIKSKVTVFETGEFEANFPSPYGATIEINQSVGDCPFFDKVVAYGNTEEEAIRNVKTISHDSMFHILFFGFESWKRSH